jgi:hypothetical protein
MAVRVCEMSEVTRNSRLSVINVIITVISLQTNCSTLKVGENRYTCRTCNKITKNVS